MSSSASKNPALDAAQLRRAVDIYMAFAYPSGCIPEVVERRLIWPECPDLASLLASPPFELANRPEPGMDAIHALRLGNALYPHMKLQIQGWANSDGFLISVNTHDQVLSLNPQARDAEAFRTVQAENQRLKEEIERAWQEAGLPTFLGYLRDYIQSHQPAEGENPEPAG